MAIRDAILWKNWADNLRQEMMTELQSEVTKSVNAIATETATTMADKTLRSARFWEDCQSGRRPTLATAGFDIEFQQDEKCKVQEVTFRLNATWLRILQGVLDRRRA